jgi:hypothetical protein
MREDEDQFRYYVPLLRRIIILVAVIAAIPVVLWTITAFVRTYVAPPKVPTFRPMSATASIPAPPVPESVAKSPAAPPLGSTALSPSPTAEARATATDARDAGPGAKGPLLGERPLDGNANAGGAPKLADLNAAIPGEATARPMDGMPAMPTASAPAGPGIAAQTTPASMDTATGALPASTPLAGPIPLPRHRPRNLDVAQLGVPVPRPRPLAASDGASDTGGASPLNWIRNIFQPQQSEQQSDQQQ